MRPRAILGFALAAAVAVGGGLVAVRFWFAREDAREISTVLRRGADALERSAGECATESAADTPRDDALRAERTNDVAPAPPHKAPPRDLPVTWVEGVVRVVEPPELPPPPWPDGHPPDRTEVDVDPARLNGSFVPDLIDGPDDDEPADPTTIGPSDSRRVRVVNGRFRFDSHGATAMLVQGLELDHRLADVEGGVELSPDTPAAVLARWTRDVLLHVVDATTHEELCDVSVVARSWKWELHPGRARHSEIVVEGQASPFHLSCRSSHGRSLLAPDNPVWIGAPGHAWQPRAFDFKPGSTETIELDAGAALIVEVKGDEEHGDERPLERRPRLRLRDVGGRTAGAVAALRDFEKQVRETRLYGGQPELPDWIVFDTMVTDEPMEFDGLPTGELVASLEVGDEGRSALVLASATVTLVAGETEHLVLTIPPKAIVDPVLVEGTLFVPPSWVSTHDLDLRFAPQGLRGVIAADCCVASVNGMTAVPGKPGWYRWRVGPILPATYRITVPRARFETLIEVGTAGRSDVSIALPEAAQLIVRIVDDATKEPVEWGYLDWSSVDDSPFAYSRREILFWDRTAQALVGSTASGNGRFEGSSIAYEFLDDPDVPSATHTIHAGHNEIVLRVKRRCGVDLRLDRAAAEVLRDTVRLQSTCLASGATDEFVWDTRLAGLADSFSRDLSHVSDPSTAAGLLQRVARNYFALPGPGRYRFSFPDFPAIASFEVDVPEREFVVYTVGK
jgi:hypothetical protein